MRIDQRGIFGRVAKELRIEEIDALDGRCGTHEMRMRRIGGVIDDRRLQLVVVEK